jgi:hypothetical protein
MIDMTRVRPVLKEIEELIDELDQLDLDETDATYRQTKTKLREIKAQRSQDLQLLATRLELAAALVRNEYWFARGEIDPLDGARG